MFFLLQPSRWGIITRSEVAIDPIPFIIMAKNVQEQQDNWLPIEGTP